MAEDKTAGQPPEKTTAPPPEAGTKPVPAEAANGGAKVAPTAGAKETLKLPTENSVDLLSPEDQPQKKSSTGNLQSRRQSTVSNMSRASETSDYGQKFGSFSAQGAIIPPAAEEAPVDKISNNDPFIKIIIPRLPLPASTICLIFNILVPGFGTILSTFLGLCIPVSREAAKEHGLGNFVCMNICVGIAQMTTITFLLVGWFWSLAWGCYMLDKSIELMKERERDRAAEESRKKALSALLGGDGKSTSGNALKSLFGARNTE